MPVFVLAYALLAPPTETSYLGLYIQGQKIGYASSTSAPGKLDGKVVQRSDGHTVLDLGLLGTPLKMTVDSSTWTLGGKPLRMTFRQESAGRVQTMDARFVGTKVRILNDNSGSKTTKLLPLPSGPIVDDPITLVQGKGVPFDEGVLGARPDHHHVPEELHPPRRPFDRRRERGEGPRDARRGHLDDRRVALLHRRERRSREGRGASRHRDAARIEGGRDEDHPRLHADRRSRRPHPPSSPPPPWRTPAG